MKIFINKKLKNKKAALIITVICLLLFFGSFAKTASANIGGSIATIIGWVVYPIIAFVGILSTVVIDQLVQVAGFSHIIDAAPVVRGWVIVRDLSNMFFILILLVIAFATILRLPNYEWKKLLPKLLIMAVLINFSRTISGLIIDFSQVIMLTFVNGFGNGVSNFIDTLNIRKFMSIKQNYSSGIGFFGTAASIIAALFFAIIVLVTVSVLLAVLIIRIIMLWIYVIFSPIAFLLSAFPAGQKYASQWWGEFSKNVIVGPVLAFFIWLALTTAKDAGQLISGASGEACKTGTLLNDIMCNQDFSRFIISIGMLIGGLIVTQQIGGIAGSMASKGMAAIQKGGAMAGKVALSPLAVGKYAGKVAGYVPAQYAKKAGYGLGDMVLGQLKKVRIIGNLAMEGQGKLRMHRDYAEEKDTKYMQYLEEQDLDRIITRQRSRGVIATLGRGMESKRQLFRRALVQKAKGDEWGSTKEEKMASKTRYLIELAQVAGHSITSSGEDAFRNADLGKLWHEYRKKNVGMIDDEQMRAYYLGQQGNAIGPNGARTGYHYNYKELRGGDNSEYWRGPDPVTGELRSPNSMVVYTSSRLRMNDVHDLHHENFIPRPDALGNLHYDVLEAVYNDGNGAMRSLAQVRDRGTRQQKVQMRAWMTHRLAAEQALGYAGSTYFRDALTDYRGPNPRATEDQFFDAMMANGGIQLPGGIRDRLGGSRAIMGQIRSAEVASGITGSDRANRGVMAANFSELGLEKAAAKYFAGDDKTEIASRIKSVLQNNGLAEVAAKAVEDQINKASYLILHNKEAGVSGGEVRTAHTHELMHARLGANFNQDELKGVWNSMDENSKNEARKQITAKWGGKMSEEAIMNEYFAEGLTAKTRWGKGAVASLDKKAEGGLDNLLKSKGSNITAFTSNIIATKPDSGQIRQSIVENVDGPLQKTMEELISALQGVGNGFGSVEKLSENFSSLQRAMERNRTSLDKSVKGYKEVNDKLSNLANKTT